MSRNYSNAILSGSTDLFPILRIYYAPAQLGPIQAQQDVGFESCKCVSYILLGMPHNTTNSKHAEPGKTDTEDNTVNEYK